MSWRTIPGLPMYEASDTGLIRSKSRSVNVRHGDRQYRKVIPGKVLKLTPTVWRGRPHYMSVPIQGKTHLVHRLVALAWLGSTWFEGAEVNHRDGNKRNNCVTNLEWVTHQQNELHSYRVLGKGRQRPLTRREAPPPPETRRHESAQRKNAVARVSEREARCRTRIPRHSHARNRTRIRRYLLKPPLFRHF